MSQPVALVFLMFPRARRRFDARYLFTSCKARLGKSTLVDRLSVLASAAFHRNKPVVIVQSRAKGVTGNHPSKTCPRPADAALRTCLFSSTSALKRNDYCAFFAAISDSCGCFRPDCRVVAFKLLNQRIKHKPLPSLTLRADSPVHAVART